MFVEIWGILGQVFFLLWRWAVDSGSAGGGGPKGEKQRGVATWLTDEV
jgi:hypothetical protein